VALQWTKLAHGDLVRIHEFLAPVSSAAAARIVQAIVARVKRIPAQPRLGQTLSEFSPREVRRLLVGDYEIRYELRTKDIFILRLFHAREDR
jgi:plasmid stabilization system protein ParE